jgi:PBP1b-binding outer membrane lipoprotein LpoB
MKFCPEKFCSYLRYIMIGIMAALMLHSVVSCASGGERVDLRQDLVSDSGGITRSELEQSATEFAGKISQYFKKNPRSEGIFVAHLPTKNETSEMIPTEFFDSKFVSELTNNGIFTVRTKQRKMSMEELAFSQSGMTSNALSIGNMKSPNFFVKTSITEAMFNVKGSRIMEQTVSIELVDVETNIAVWSDRTVFRKKAASRGGATW